MRNETITLYQFHELSEKAKEKARDWYREGDIYHWHDEDRASIEAFCDAFNARLSDWSVGAFMPYHYRVDASNDNFRGRRLREFNRDHMPTGYCLDCALWATFYDEFKKTGDAKGAFYAALDAGFKAWRDDIEYAYSDAAVDESIELNEYEFEQDGRRARF